ncbi:hypothetical protein AC578_1256 [Pseudocercospora eumusae]|uniref:Mid2 domain-containing protein n=1 Tax=Pseudocercospora eumusae TaxID=321146 RepID=A0A139H8A2_9PEZI|nr:hypothetical protein AC578_1256 [Pseudocercospora eumusae]
MYLVTAQRRSLRAAPASDSVCKRDHHCSFLRKCCRLIHLDRTNGLCLGSGVLSRGSCTDKEWKDESCAQYCRNDNPSGGFGLMPCSFETFTCGFFPDNCRVPSSTFSIKNADGLILRSSQLTSMMEAAGIDQGPAANVKTRVEDDNKTYTLAAMAGVGAGVGGPLLVVVAILSYLLVRDRKRMAAITNDTLSSPRSPKGHEMSSGSPWNSPGPEGDVKRRQSTKGAAELSPETVHELETSK